MGDVVGGLRETGEPARKALIVDLAPAQLRGRSGGLYYLVRILAIAPAAFGGGLPWRVDPMIPFVCAASLGLLGTLVLALTVSSEETARI